jgi:hypothetical protein
MPTITGVSPQAFGDGRSVTVTGSGFGASGTVTIGGLTQTVTSWTDTAVVFTAVRGTQSMGPAVLDVVGVGSWQLADGHWVAARMPMVTVHPHSAAGSDAQFRWAHPSMEYRQPIGVQGGAWPFYYELVAAPAGATIGNFLAWNASTSSYDVPEDYGVVRWTPTSGTKSFTVRVTDQGGATLTITWDVVVDATKFVFVSGSAAGGGTGSITSPFTWVECFGTLESTSNNPGKIAVMRGGTIICTGFSDTNNPGTLNLSGTKKPKSWLAYPGEAPVLDFNYSTKVLFNGSGDSTGHMSDCSFIGLRFRNSWQNVNNAHYFWATDRCHRALWWRNYFETIECGLVGNDNPACIFLNGAGRPNPREHVAIIQNTFDGMGVGGGNGVASVDSYNCRYSLWEHNTLKNMRSSYGHWQKGEHQFCTVRHETAVENITADKMFMFTVATEGATGMDSHSNEFCFNTGVSDTGVIYSFGYTQNTSGRYDIWSYRNSMRGNLLNGLSSSVPQQVALYDVTTDTDVDNSLAIATWPGTYGNTNLLLAVSAIDANGKLTGASRALYLGTHGSEIA